MRLTAATREALAATGCALRFDELTRRLYATDASPYQLEPVGVAFPRTTGEAAGVLRVAAEAGLPVSPRGAGTGLAGGAIGEGLILDLARHNQGITDLDREAGTVRVGAGVVLDPLNAFLRPHGLWFGPDVATSSRATLGGMIANNSSGAHAPVYGTTVDHVVSLEVVLAGGRTAVIGRDAPGLGDLRDRVDRVVASHAAEIAARLPPGLVKRWPGYGFDDALREPGDLTRVVTGSEGTLAAITSAVVKVVPLPKRRAVAVLFFDSVAEAMEASAELCDLGAAAIEHLDRLVLDQTRGQPPFRAARALLKLDEAPPEALLVVELFDDAEDKLAWLARRRLGTRQLRCADAAEQELVWAVRRAGLSLLTGCAGPAKPLTCIEDVCVRPEQLPAYVAGLREILAPHGVQASFYGHAASGLLHVRPKLDLHRPEHVAAMKQISDEVADLCRRFGGSLAGEHGVGMARTAYLEGQIGPALMEATRRIKAIFDPRDVLNPGKIVDAGRFDIHRDLRVDLGTPALPEAGLLGFVDKDRSFAGNLEQCNGCGGCRKATPTMCPTFAATGDEAQSTRGRANILRAALTGRLGDDPTRVSSAALDEVLSSCLSCKACKLECPSNVDVAQLKAEVLHARHRLEGPALIDRMVAATDTLGRLGTLAPGLANAALAAGPVRRLMARLVGIDAARPLPPYAKQRFDRWFRRRGAPSEAPRGWVLLWDDTWVRYHEPHVGQAAVAVLEAAGFAVDLVRGRKCCGRPAFSRGLLDEVRALGEHNLALLRDGDAPIVFLEPSCWSMFVDDYRQLGLAGADAVAARCVQFERFVAELLDREPHALTFKGELPPLALHGHCHAKALEDVGPLRRLLERLPTPSATLLPTGCCGMAGAFGMMESKAELSRQVAADLVEKVAARPDGAAVVASGTSCRHQIEHLTDARPRHLAELIAGVIDR